MVVSLTCICAHVHVLVIVRGGLCGRVLCPNRNRKKHHRAKTKELPYRHKPALSVGDHVHDSASLPNFDCLWFYNALDC